MKEVTLNDFFNEIERAVEKAFNEMNFSKEKSKDDVIVVSTDTNNYATQSAYEFNSTKQDDLKTDKNVKMMAKALCPTTINTNLKLKSRGEMITDLVDNYVWVDGNGICWLVEDMNKEHLINVFNKMEISEGHRKHVLSFIKLVGTMKPASRKIFGADRFKAKEFSNSKVVRVVDVRTI